MDTILKYIEIQPYMGSVEMTDQITVSVDADVAAMYRSASEDDRLRLDMLIDLHLREAMAVRHSEKSLQDIMETISRNAQRRGLTPEILQDILAAE